MRKKYTGEIRIDREALFKQLKKIPKHRVVFVCSMNDLFAEKVPKAYIFNIIGMANHIDDGNRIFLFQTKNPRRMIEFFPYFPPKSILGTTIESNRELIKTEAPPPIERYKAMKELREKINIHKNPYKLMVNIEPILDFDLEVMVKWMSDIRPDFISIGADSKHKNLPEPSTEKVKSLIQELEGISEVRLKKNLGRLLD